MLVLCIRVGLNKQNNCSCAASMFARKNQQTFVNKFKTVIWKRTCSTVRKRGKLFEDIPGPPDKGQANESENKLSFMKVPFFQCQNKVTR